VAVNRVMDIALATELTRRITMRLLPEVTRRKRWHF
jgi:hypothetical protein